MYSILKFIFLGVYKIHSLNEVLLLLLRREQVIKLDDGPATIIFHHANLVRLVKLLFQSLVPVTKVRVLFRKELYMLLSLEKHFLDMRENAKYRCEAIMAGPFEKGCATFSAHGQALIKAFECIVHS